MFKKIEFNEFKLNNQFHDYESILTAKTLSEAEIAELVRKNVCMQSALSDLFSLKLEHASTGFCFKEPSKKDAEMILSALSQLFRSAVAANFSDSYYSVQIHVAKPAVYSIVQQLYEECSINPFVAHFHEKTGFANDVREAAVFEFDKESTDFKDIEEIDEEYLSFLYNCFKYECNYGIPANAFSMDELCGDRYLRSVAKYAKHMYIFVFPVNINGKDKYQRERGICKVNKAFVLIRFLLCS